MEQIDSQPEQALRTLVRQSTQQSSIDEDSLLYKTYDDYFNTEEEMLSPLGAPVPPSPENVSLISRQFLHPHQPDQQSLEPSFPKLTQPFYFVLSSPSPGSPHSSGSSSLLEVINVMEQTTPSDRRSDQPSSPLTPPTTPMFEGAPATPSPIPAEQPRGRLQFSGTLDPQARMTYPSASVSTRSSSVPCTRIRHAQPMSMIESRAYQGSQHPIGKHVRGRSSPFPLPIRFSFAPPSVPGSSETPYSYF